MSHSGKMSGIETGMLVTDLQISTELACAVVILRSKVIFVVDLRGFLWNQYAILDESPARYGQESGRIWCPSERSDGACQCC